LRDNVRQTAHVLPFLLAHSNHVRITMRLHRSIAIVGLLSALVACSRDATPRIDDALRQDLSLAAAVQPYAPQQYMSPVEQVNGYAPQGHYAPQPYYATPRAPTPVVYRSAPRVIRRTSAPSPVYDESSSEGVYTEEVVKKNTKRDAIIGAAAGAAIGAVSTRNRVKGAIIGGVAGGILGAVVGEKIDVQRSRIPR
jgi:hypothetical protein